MGHREARTDWKTEIDEVCARCATEVFEALHRGGRVRLLPQFSVVGVVLRGVVIDVHAVLPLKAKHFEPVLVAPGCTVEAFDDSALREGGIVSDGHRYGSAGAGQGDVLCSRRE